MTHLLAIVVDEQVEGDGSHHVNEKPAFEVMHGDAQWVAHHLVVGVDISGAEIDEDVDDEHDVDDKVHVVEWLAVCAGIVLLLRAKQEGSAVWCYNGSVDHQQQNQPVPHSLEWAVVQHGPLVDAWCLKLVFRKDISA